MRNAQEIRNMRDQLEENIIEHGWDAIEKARVTADIPVSSEETSA